MGLRDGLSLHRPTVLALEGDCGREFSFVSFWANGAATTHPGCLFDVIFVAPFICLPTPFCPFIPCACVL